MTSVSASTPRRLRAASPAVHAGASSLLRLARGSEARLPSGAALSGWVERAASMLDLTPLSASPPARRAAVVTSRLERQDPMSARELRR